MDTKMKVGLLLCFVLYYLTVFWEPFDIYVNKAGKVVIILWMAWQLASIVVKSFLLPRLPQVSSKEKGVLVTGCDSGFGHSTALFLNKYGFTVYAGCLFPEGEGAQKLNRNAYYPEKLHVIGINITNDEDIENAFQTINQLMNNNEKLWGIVNNAGVIRMGEVEWGSFEFNFKSTMEVNTLGAVKITRKFLPLIRESKGRIVNMASIAGRISAPTIVSYNMSKYALVAFSEGLRREMFKFGVRVSSVEPFIYATRMSGSGVISDAINTCWETTPEDVQNAYGHRYFGRFRKTSVAQTGLANNAVQDVVDAVFDALTSPEPQYSYTVCPLFLRPLMFLAYTVPQEWFDFGLKIALITSKRNKPCPTPSFSPSPSNSGKLKTG